MAVKKISTIEMTRKIRDGHAKRLAGKSYAERIAFYRARAKKMEKKLPVLLSELAIAEGAETTPKTATSGWMIRTWKRFSNGFVRAVRPTRKNRRNGASITGALFVHKPLCSFVSFVVEYLRPPHCLKKNGALALTH